MSAETGVNIPPAPRTKLRRWHWFALAILALAAGALALYLDLPVRLQAWLRVLLDWLGGLGPWGPVIFILLYILACVLFVPASVLTLGGGALFGLAKGSLYVLIGASLGATAAFLVGRYVARDWVARKIGKHPAFAAIDRAVAQEGWKIVGLVRLSPIFPFFLMNYAFGLTRVSLRDYVLASAFGMIPGTVLYVYIGSLANEAARPAGAVRWTLRGAGLLATVLVVVLLTRIAKKALANRISR